ncbi:uncharacterized protein LOC101889514 [Musca domestica]|uniref:Uncharacterized protein LOC101889514 n=1 Tax=Musca domestica TaxID=7370 RepID=A0A1I8N7W4_MUSDO|nr:uncharacterized protein LOC101889514 [Musca domestica]
MKFIILLLVVAVAVCQAAPVDDESAAKSKRGLHLGLGYHHAPFVSHSYVAPAVVHHAPVIAHAPLIAHAPIYTSHHIVPAYHSYHHFK